MWVCFLVIDMPANKSSLTRIISMSKKFTVSIFRGLDTSCPNSIVNLIDLSSSYKVFFSKYGSIALGKAIKPLPM